MRTGYKPGLHLKKNRFSGDTFVSVYQRHTQVLEKLKESASLSFHELMAKIFKLVM